MRTSVISIAAACILVAGSAFASEEIAGEFDCMGCHSVKEDKALPDKYGPYFTDIANEYKEKGDKAVSLLENSILRGSKHKWDRPVDMQPRSENGKTIDQENAKKMAEWIMSLAGKDSAE
ncbi:c-type cytochrome [Candidatus Electrothrix sp.]|uniref:c-type cytochrome n=1 Tax=Candidatus Electrothrix sp. TaxID=2170559 RepID=UPI004055CDC6